MNQREHELYEKHKSKRMARLRAIRQNSPEKKRAWQTLQSIATFYGVDVDSLVTLAVDPPPRADTVGITISGAQNMHPDTLAALVELVKAAYKQLSTEV